jgi:hypothetical protein
MALFVALNVNHQETKGAEGHQDCFGMLELH